MSRSKLGIVMLVEPKPCKTSAYEQGFEDGIRDSSNYNPQPLPGYSQEQKDDYCEGYDDSRHIWD